MSNDQIFCGRGLWSILLSPARGQWRYWADVEGSVQFLMCIFFFLYNLLTYEEVGSGCRQSKLLLHVLGCEGDLADDRVKPQDAPTKKQAVDWGSQQTL